MRKKAVGLGLSEGLCNYCCVIFACCKFGFGSCRGNICCFEWGRVVVCITMLTVMFSCKGIV